MSTLIQILTLGFGLFSAVLYFLAFVYPDVGKEKSKEKLKQLSQLLREQTFFQLGKDYFTRILNQINTYKKGMRFFWYFLIPMFFLNVVIIPGSCLLAEYIKHADIQTATRILLSYKMYNVESWRIAVLHICAGSIGVVLNIASLSLTLKLLRKMSRARSRLLLFFHIFLNCFIVLWFAFFLVPTAVFFNWKIADTKGTWSTFAEAWKGTFHDKPDILIPLLYGATSAIPTVLYLLTALVIIIFKLFPGSVRNFLIDIIKALTRDDRNVFSDLGKFFAVIAGIVAAAKFLVEF